MPQREISRAKEVEIGSNGRMTFQENIGSDWAEFTRRITLPNEHVVEFIMNGGGVKNLL